MIRRLRTLPTLLLAISLAGGLSGCATLPAPKLPTATGPVSAQRKTEVVASFESQRDEAQLQAALNRWKEGNSPACEKLLRELLTRRPDYVDARVQYAEWLVSQNNLPAAEGELREALRQAPQRADAHHSLGIVLELSGRLDESRQHFRQALALEPANELYQLSAADGPSTPSPPGRGPG